MHLSKKHLNNLTKLADFLEKEVTNKQFDISFYLENNYEHIACNKVVDECGTIGCAIGWATSLFFNEAKKSHNYCDFSREVFGCCTMNMGERLLVAKYMFDGCWSDVRTQKSKAATVKRIREVVRHKGKLTKRQVAYMEKHGI